MGSVNRRRCVRHPVVSRPHRVEDRAGERREDVVHPGEIVAGETSPHRDGRHVDQVLGAGTEHVDPQDPTRGFVQDRLDQPLGLRADGAGA